MRTLSANLTTAQQAQSRTPYITIDLTSHDGDTMLSFKTTDATNKILNVKQAEGRFGGEIRVAGGGESFSAIISLRDADGNIGGTDRRGYRVDIGWGLNTVGGNEVSKSEAVFVWRQRREAREGDIVLDLYCVSLFDLARNRFLSNSTSGPLEYEGNITIRHILMAFLGDFQLAAAIRDDGGVFTDFTAAANSPKPSDLGSADDVGMFSTSPQINDAFYFGLSRRSVGLSIDLVTPGSGGSTPTFVWEYWNGASWASLSHPENSPDNVLDGTSGFDTGELKIVSWTHPGTGWATTTVNSQGPFFYVRARVSVAGTHTNAVTATKITISDKGFNIALDSATGTTGEDFKPEITADYRQADLTYAQLLLGMTTLGIITKNDGFHALFVDNAQVSADYTYDTSHNVYADVAEDALILPNRYEYVSSDPLNLKVAVKFTGSAENSASQTAWGGTYTALVVDESIKSGADADNLAQRHIDRDIRDTAQGTVLAPMNVGQEIWDLVQVNDIWTGVNNKGRVAHLVREFTPGVYQIELTLGGYIGLIQTPTQTLLNADDLRVEALTEQQRALFDLNRQLQQEQVNISLTLLSQLQATRSEIEFDTAIEARRILTRQAAAGELSPETIEVINIASAAQELAAIVRQNRLNVDALGNQPPVPTLFEMLMLLSQSQTVPILGLTEGLQRITIVPEIQRQVHAPLPDVSPGDIGE